MKKVTIHKAEPLRFKTVEGVEIHITKNLPPIDNVKSFKDVEEFYKTDAVDLFDALKKNLPQGVLFQQLILMLKDSPNLYRGI